MGKIYNMPDDLRQQVLESILEEVVVNKTNYDDALLSISEKYRALYSLGHAKILVTQYYINVIFTDHCLLVPGFLELLLNHKNSMSKKEMSTDEIIVKVFKQQMRALNDFDKAIDASVSLMNEKGYPVKELQFHNVLAKHMYQLIRGNLKNTLNFIKTANKEQLQIIINEAQSYLVA